MQTTRYTRINEELVPQPFSSEKGCRPQGAELSKEHRSDTVFEEDVFALGKPKFLLPDRSDSLSSLTVGGFCLNHVEKVP